MYNIGSRFSEFFIAIAADLLRRTPIHTGEWQAQNVSKSVLHATFEIMDTHFTVAIPDNIDALAEMVHPSPDWAEEHFQERVSGHPLNPPPSHVRWPWAQKGNADHTSNDEFSHTYPERFWPRFANEGTTRPNGRQVFVPHNGIRYEYGDLNDVVDLLVRNPLSRQAYLPVWFPEDTGALSRQRVPCSLGYHFMIRNNVMHCWYAIRSCDFVRHFRDDVYHAGRLMQWVANEYNMRTLTTRPVEMGELHMTISSLHAFLGDQWSLEQLVKGSNDDVARHVTAQS